MAGRLDKLFGVSERGSTVSREIVAGLTTFAAISYILVVNPQILSAAGMDRDSLITATALSAIVGTLVMALWANLPIALAAGMGSNIIFAHVVVGQLGVSWRTALAMVFSTGVLFLALSLSRWREWIVAGFPREIQIGLQGSIGIFIAYLGLKNGGLVVSSESTFIAFGDLSEPATLLVFAGLLLTPILMVRRVPGAFLISIALLTVAGFFVSAGGDAGGTTMTRWPQRLVEVPKLSSELLFAFDFRGFFDNFFLLLPVALYFFLSDFFATAATLIGVTRQGNLLTPQGTIPRAREAFSADAVATVAGAALGTSTVTSYVESVTGIEAGGRTGLSGVVVSLMFAISMFLWPLFAIVPPQATTPTLVLVGVLMLQGVLDIETASPVQTLTPLLTILMTACTADLMIGLATGCFVYTLLVAANREWGKLTPMLLLVDASLVVYVALTTRLA